MEETEDHPDEFVDPISLELMADPQICADGFTYERRTIEKWFEKSNSSPMTGAPVASQALIPNRALRTAIERYVEERGGAPAGPASPPGAALAENPAARALRARMREQQARQNERRAAPTDSVKFVAPGAVARLVVAADVAAVFHRVLQFWYTGVYEFADNHDLVDETRAAAQRFGCDELVTICANQLEGNAFLNPSIGTFLNDKNGEQMKELFLGRPLLSDMVFAEGPDGLRIPAHAAVVRARCPYFAKMGACVRIKRRRDVPAYRAALEYIYTGHAPIVETGALAVLRAASKLGLSRLVTLCELYASKEIETRTADEIIKCDLSVVEFLNAANKCRAKQLAAFCRHFLCVNNVVYRQREDWADLSRPDASYVEEHQWPPKSYLKAVEEYELEKLKLEKGKHAAGKEGCFIM